jgi:hypothetical protein
MRSADNVSAQVRNLGEMPEKDLPKAIPGMEEKESMKSR